MTGLYRILCDFIPHPKKWLLVLQSNTCIHFSKDHCSQKEEYFHLRLYICLAARLWHPTLPGLSSANMESLRVAEQQRDLSTEQSIYDRH